MQESQHKEEENYPAKREFRRGIATPSNQAATVIKVKTKGMPLWGTHRLRVLKHYRLRL